MLSVSAGTFATLICMVCLHLRGQFPSIQSTFADLQLLDAVRRVHTLTPSDVAQFHDTHVLILRDVVPPTAISGLASAIQQSPPNVSPLMSDKLTHGMNHAWAYCRSSSHRAALDIS